MTTEFLHRAGSRRTLGLITWLSPHDYEYTPEEQARIVDPAISQDVSPSEPVELLELISILKGAIIRVVSHAAAR
jgi:hypothetical protein